MNSFLNYIRSYIPFYKRNLAIAIPVMLAQLGQGLVQLADTIMVGHVGVTDLAAASFGGAVFFIGFGCCLGLTMGSTPLIGKEYAAGNHATVARLFLNSILFDLLVGVVLCIVMYAASCFMDRMGQPDEVWPLAMTYYRILLASLPFVLLFQAFRQFLEGLGNTQLTMYVTIGGNLLNVGLNWAMIFGHFGLPAMGVAGAAYATLISRIIMCATLVIWVLNKKQFSDYIKDFSRSLINRETLGELYKISWPIGLQTMLEPLGMNIAVLFVGWCGTTALASHEIAINISCFTWMISCGIASATTIRVSHQIGVKDYVAMKKAGIASIHLVLAFMGICSVLILLLRTPIAKAFSNDPGVLEVAPTLLILLALFQLADGVQTVVIGALRGMQDVKTPVIVAAICYITTCLAVGYFCCITLGWGAVGVWVGYLTELYLASIILLFAFHKKSYQLMDQKPA